MNQLNKIIVFSTLAFFLAGISQIALAESRELTKDEIVTMFSGKTAWGNHARRDLRNKIYFAPDGTYIGKRLDERGGTRGKWYVDDKNRLCMEKNGDTKCRKVVDKKGKIKKYKGDKHVWNYTKFKDGNKI